MAVSAPATPVKQTPQIVPSNAPAGNWRHPRLDEINRRRNAATFNEDNMRSITWNLLFLVVAASVPGVLASV